MLVRNHSMTFYWSKHVWKAICFGNTFKRVLFICVIRLFPGRLGYKAVPVMRLLRTLLNRGPSQRTYEDLTSL